MGEPQRFRHFAKLNERVDTRAILGEIERSTDAWHADTSRQRRIRCQRDTLAIMLRTARKPLPRGVEINDAHESAPTRQAERFARTLAYCEDVAQEIEGTLGRAMLVALLPGGNITPHIDHGAYYQARDRLHLVLLSPDGSPMTAGGERVTMREGDLWAFDNKARHAAANPSALPRIHLIFDIEQACGRAPLTRGVKGSEDEAP